MGSLLSDPRASLGTSSNKDGLPVSAFSRFFRENPFGEWIRQLDDPEEKEMDEEAWRSRIMCWRVTRTVTRISSCSGW